MLTRRRVRMSSLVCLMFLTVACAQKLPPGYSAQAQRAMEGHQILQEVMGLSRVVINLNALPPNSVGRISDDDTRIVRDFALATSDGVGRYVDLGAPDGILAAWTSLQQRLSANTKISPQVKAALALVSTQIQIITGVKDLTQ